MFIQAHILRLTVRNHKARAAENCGGRSEFGEGKWLTEQSPLHLEICLNVFAWLKVTIRTPKSQCPKCFPKQNHLRNLKEMAEAVSFSHGKIGRVLLVPGESFAPTNRPNPALQLFARGVFDLEESAASRSRPQTWTTCRVIARLCSWSFLTDMAGLNDPKSWMCWSRIKWVGVCGCVCPVLPFFLCLCFLASCVFVVGLVCIVLFE